MTFAADRTRSLDYPALLERIAADVRSERARGNVATYIPELAKVRPDAFGLALRTVDGQVFHTGDADERFSIQSISKVFALALALSVAPGDTWLRVGVEPSGDPFNSLVQLEYERGIPRNPFINAGAIVVCDILLEHFDDPLGEILERVRKLAEAPDIECDVAVAKSELECGFRNEAVANFMKSFRNIHGNVEEVLDFYVHLCAIEMSCVELSRAMRFLADDRTLEPLRIGITPAQAKRMNAVMLTCGFYDEAGEFAFRVGLPGKSGVGGGIVATCPHHYSVAVWSPRLNDKGNSHLGMLALEKLTSATDTSIF